MYEYFNGDHPIYLKNSFYPYTNNSSTTISIDSSINIDSINIDSINIERRGYGPFRVPTSTMAASLSSNFKITALHNNKLRAKLYAQHRIIMN